MFIRRLLRSSFTGLVVGAGAGALTSVADMLRSLAGLGNRIDPSTFLEVALWYTGVWAAGGLVLGAVLGLALARAVRWTALVVIAGSVWFFATLLVNVEWLPGFALTISLATDLALLGAAGLLLFFLDRRLRRPDNVRFFAAATAAVLLGAAAVVTLAPPAGGRHPEPVDASRGHHPSVLLIVVDSLRADHTSIGGYGRDTTPTLSRFAEGGLVYAQARSTACWTKPSATTILTGLPPGVHGVEGEPDLVPRQAHTIAEVFSAGGYTTGLFSSNHYVSDYFGLGQGFDRVIDPLTGRGLGRLGLPAPTLLGHVAIAILEKKFHALTPATDQARGGLVTDFLWWLDSEDPARPWFAYLHFMEPHYPYDPPGRFLERFTDRMEKAVFPPDLEVGLAPFEPGEKIPDEARSHMIDAYDAEILRWDDRFRILLEDLESRGQLEDLVIVVTADHGEAFADHGTWAHGNSLYEELIHVPLVIRGPGVSAGRHDRAVSLTGLPSAVVGLAGFEAPPEMLEWAAPVHPAPEADQVSHARTRRSEKFMLAKVDGARKWIFARWRGEEALQWFDLDSDSGESTDLAPSRAGSAREALAALLARSIEEAEHSLSGEEAEVEGDLEQALRGLGYLR